MKVMKMGELRQKLQEELAKLKLAVKVFGPFQRADGTFVSVVYHTWKTFENERASFRMRKFQDAHAADVGADMALTPEEHAVVRDTAQDSAYAIRLDARDAKEAQFGQQMLVAELEGLGFKTESRPGAGPKHPYR